jgi:hypothetical protein
MNDATSLQVVAFLNSASGGTLYIGIHDSGRVLGVDASRHARDLFRQGVNGMVQRICPSPLPGMVHVTFVSVNGATSADTAVVEVRVAPGLSKHQPIPYESFGKHAAYVKLAGGTFVMAGPQRIALYEAAKRGKHGKILKALQQPKLRKHRSKTKTSQSESKMCAIL